MSKNLIFSVISILAIILILPLIPSLVSGQTALTVTITSPADNATFKTGQTINFSAAVSGGAPSYGFLWNFGDGTTGAGVNFTKTYTTTGSKTVKITATDFDGTQAVAQISVNIETVTPSPSPLTVNIINPTVGREAMVDEMIDFSAAATGGNPPYVFHWDFGDGTTFNGQTRRQSYSAAGTKTVTVTATDFSGGTATRSIALKINASTTPPIPPTTGALTISNIRVTDITTNSAIVRWTTNNPATSRVIYDIVSHPNIGSQSAPNFGYASSTATTDIDAKVTEHTVTINNLLPSTNYYFRVISQ
ncbi:MAG: PKD domain-containing protein [Patescibacteria group bacterium]